MTDHPTTCRHRAPDGAHLARWSCSLPFPANNGPEPDCRAQTASNRVLARRRSGPVSRRRSTSGRGLSRCPLGRNMAGTKPPFRCKSFDHHQGLVPLPTNGVGIGCPISPRCRETRILEPYLQFLTGRWYRLICSQPNHSAFGPLPVWAMPIPDSRPRQHGLHAILDVGFGFSAGLCPFGHPSVLVYPPVWPRFV